MADIYLLSTPPRVTPVNPPALPSALVGPAIAQDLRAIGVTFAALPAVVASAVPLDYLRDAVAVALNDLNRLLDSASPHFGDIRYVGRKQFDDLVAVIDLTCMTWGHIEDGDVARTALIAIFARFATEMLTIAGVA